MEEVYFTMYSYTADVAQNAVKHFKPEWECQRVRVKIWDLTFNLIRGSIILLYLANLFN